jgi:hypothetical protein
MTTARLLTKALLVGLLALLVGSLALGYVESFFDSAYQPLNWMGLTASGVVTVIGALYIGGAVVALYGAPAFTALAVRGRATWPYVLLLGAAPGLAGFFYHWAAGLLLLAFGVPIAAVVRRVCGPGPNNSFKPKPLRGSA